MCRMLGMFSDLIPSRKERDGQEYDGFCSQKEFLQPNLALQQTLPKKVKCVSGDHCLHGRHTEVGQFHGYFSGVQPNNQGLIIPRLRKAYLFQTAPYFFFSFNSRG